MTAGFKTSGREGVIRTLGTGVSPYNGLANRRIRPLCHLSGGPSISLPRLCSESGWAGAASKNYITEITTPNLATKTAYCIYRRKPHTGVIDPSLTEFKNATTALGAESRVPLCSVFVTEFIFFGAPAEMVKHFRQRGGRVDPKDCPRCGGSGYLARPVDISGKSEGV